jgi:hypothetical protein
MPFIIRKCPSPAKRYAPAFFFATLSELIAIKGWLPFARAVHAVLVRNPSSYSIIVRTLDSERFAACHIRIEE